MLALPTISASRGYNELVMPVRKYTPEYGVCADRSESKQERMVSWRPERAFEIIVFVVLTLFVHRCCISKQCLVDCVGVQHSALWLAGEA